VIKAPKVSDKNKYIQSMKMNGESYNKLSIDHKDLVNGATLEFEMGSKPSKWGTGKDALPSSITPVDENGYSSIPEPLEDLTDHLINKGKGKAMDSEDGKTKRLFDNTSRSQWIVNSQSPLIQYHFRAEKQEAQMYTLTSSKGDQGRDPKSWILKGSNDGKKWDVVDKRTNEFFKWRRHTRPFEIQNPGKYSYYKL